MRPYVVAQWQAVHDRAVNGLALAYFEVAPEERHLAIPAGVKAYWSEISKRSDIPAPIREQLTVAFTRSLIARLHQLELSPVDDLMRAGNE